MTQKEKKKLFKLLVTKFYLEKIKRFSELCSSLGPPLSSPSSPKAGHLDVLRQRLFGGCGAKN